MKTKVKSNFIIAGCSAFILGLFAPLDFLYSNLDDLWMDIYNVIDGVLLVTGILFMVLFIILAVESILSYKLRFDDIAIKILISYMTIAFYIQGNYIRIPYGALNGNPIVWNDYLAEDITSICAWLGMLLLVLLAIWRLGREKTIRYLIRCLAAISAVALFTLLVEYGILGGMRNKTEKMATTQNMWTYSEEKNVNILLLDYFDSRLLTELLQEDDEVSDILSDFEGFTFFRDTLGCYNLTDYSIPTILTGGLYLGQSTYGEYVNKAYDESALMQKLRGEKWNTNFYTTVTLPQGKTAKDIDNIAPMHLKPKYKAKFIIDFYGMICFRYFPTPLKRYFYDCYFEVGANRAADVDNRTNSDYKLIEAYNWDNIVWYNGCVGEYDKVERKTFHFYHLKGVHPPRQYDSDFRFTANPDEISLHEGAKLNLIIAREWINRLKEEGVYDNSVLIIMADHGSWEYEDGHHLSQTPLLMIKGYSEKHDFMINDGIPVSYIDMSEAITELMDGKKAVDCFDNMLRRCKLMDREYKHVQGIEEFVISLNDAAEPRWTGRYRPFFFIYLMNEMGTDSVGGPFYEGFTEYPAYEADYMIQTGNVY